MARLYVAAALILAIDLGQAGAQIQPLPEIQMRPSIMDRLYRPPPQRWGEVGTPPDEPMVDRVVPEGAAFDLALGPGGLPVLVFIDERFNVHVARWDGQRWIRRRVEVTLGYIPVAVKAASSTSGDVVIAVRLSWENDIIDVYRLDGSELVSLPEPLALQGSTATRLRSTPRVQSSPRRIMVSLR